MPNNETVYGFFKDKMDASDIANIIRDQGVLVTFNIGHYDDDNEVVISSEEKRSLKDICFEVERIEGLCANHARLNISLLDKERIDYNSAYYEYEGGRWILQCIREPGKKVLVRINGHMA